MEDIIELKGKKDGPISMILVGVHGNERCGVEAIEKILPQLHIEIGTVFIGYGNPEAIKRNVRSTEANLNRMFKPNDMLTDAEKQSYEYKRAQFLKPYLDQSEVLLDIHASSNPQSKIFAICEDNAAGITQHLPIPLLVSGFDEVEPGGTDYYMNSIGKIGICVECGHLADQNSTIIAEESIHAFLIARKHIKGEVRKQNQSHIHIYELYYSKTDKFKVSRPFADFEEIKKDSVIGTDGEEEIKASKDSVILFAKDRHAIGEESFLLGEK